MRLLLVTPQMYPGGAERDMLNLAAGLVSRGHAVCLAAAPGPLSPEAAGTGARIVDCPAHARTPWGLARFGRRLTELVREFDPELVHSQAVLPAWAIRRALGRRLPLLATIHNLQRRSSYPLAAVLLRASIDRAVFASAYERRLFSYWGFPQSRARVIHSGLPDPPEPVVSSPDLETENMTPFTYLFAARIDGRKGHRGLLRGLAALTTPPDFQVLIAGDGPHRRSLERLSRRLGLGEHLRWLGFRRDVPALLRSVDALVLPSLRESLPLSIREAFAAGLPVVAAAVGGVPELITPGVNGLLIERGDDTELVRVMRWLARRPATAREMGKRARRLFEERWTRERYLDDMERLYGEMITRHDPA